jgi:hypothetical protein
MKFCSFGLLKQQGGTKWLYKFQEETLKLKSFKTQPCGRCFEEFKITKLLNWGRLGLIQQIVDTEKLMFIRYCN